MVVCKDYGKCANTHTMSTNVIVMILNILHIHVLACLLSFVARELEHIRRYFHTHTPTNPHAHKKCSAMSSAPIIMFILTPTRRGHALRIAKVSACGAPPDLYVKYIYFVSSPSQHIHTVSECIHLSLIVPGIYRWTCLLQWFSGGSSYETCARNMCAWLTKSLFGSSLGGNCRARSHLHLVRGSCSTFPTFAAHCWIFLGRFNIQRQWHTHMPNKKFTLHRWSVIDWMLWQSLRKMTSLVSAYTW